MTVDLYKTSAEQSSAKLGSVGESVPRSSEAPHAGVLIINADDWGRNRETTERTLECVACGTVSSVSAMVFMEDSERAATVARERGIDAGLHLNLTTPFSAANCPASLRERQREIAAYLLRHPLSRTVFNPWLARSFDYVLKAQREEFVRLYGTEPERIDGHHHMHLCANVLFAGLLPRHKIVRRHFSYEPGEKVVRNGLFRRFTDFMLTRRYRVADFFFSLPPLEPPQRLQRIFSLAQKYCVELETHPVNPGEHRFLTRGEIFRRMENLTIASTFILSSNVESRFN